MKKLIVAVVLSLFIFSAHAQEINADRLAAFFLAMSIVRSYIHGDGAMPEIVYYVYIVRDNLRSTEQRLLYVSPRRPVENDLPVLPAPYKYRIAPVSAKGR